MALFVAVRYTHEAGHRVAEHVCYYGKTEGQIATAAKYSDSSFGTHWVAVPVTADDDEALLNSGWLHEGRQWICPEHAKVFRKEQKRLVEGD
jgi:hypothetical protein